MSLPVDRLSFYREDHPLQQWKKAALDSDEKIDRISAFYRILNVVDKNGDTLDLSDLDLTSLPPIPIPWLKTFIVAHSVLILDDKDSFKVLPELPEGCIVDTKNREFGEFVLLEDWKEQGPSKERTLFEIT